MGLMVTTGACRPSRLTDASWHPLAEDGCAPKEATGWGQNRHYVFVAVDDFRFIWCAASARSEGFWFCEVAGDSRIPDKLRLDDVPVREATDEEVSIIHESDGFKRLQYEHERKARQEAEGIRLAEEHAQWIRDHPEEWAKIQKEDERQRKEMEEQMDGGKMR